MDVLAIDGGDEGLVQGLVDLVRHAIGSALGVVHVLVVLVAQVFIAIVGDQLGKGTSGLHNAIRMLVEHFEKIALARQQLAKQHQWLLMTDRCQSPGWQLARNFGEV